MNIEPSPDPNETAFLEFLNRHRNGEAIKELSQALRKVVAGVNLTGKAGKLVFKISVNSASRGKGAVILSDDINDKTPELGGGHDSFWFATENGDLPTEDPRQKNLSLEVLERREARAS